MASFMQPDEPIGAGTATGGSMDQLMHSGGASMASSIGLSNPNLLNLTDEELDAQIQQAAYLPTANTNAMVDAGTGAGSLSMSTSTATVTQQQPRAPGLTHASSSTSTMTGTIMGGSLFQTLPTSGNNGGLAPSQRNASTPGFCCNIEVSLDTLKQTVLMQAQGLEQQPPNPAVPAGTRTLEASTALVNLIRVVDTPKAHDGSGSSYTAYVIKYGDRELKRRYSEFASLRKCLGKLYPTQVIPPIPEKHSLADYATKQTRAKQDRVIIDKRKRMLQLFLNRIAWHPILSTEHLFHRFLEPGVLWSDILHSAKVTTLPKSSAASGVGGVGVVGGVVVGAGGSAGVAGAGSSLAASFLSTLTSAATGNSGPPATAVKNPDPKFVQIEEFTLKFESILRDQLEKAHRRLGKRYVELSTDYTELAAAYNALSLSEAPAVASALDHVERAFNHHHGSIANLARQLDEVVGEPLHEYVQFVEVIKGVLRHRTEHQLAFEATCDALEAKRAYLAQLEKMEAEAQRLSDALRREGDPTATPSGTLGGSSSPAPAKKASSSGGMGGGFVSALSERFTAILDADPAATRRHNLAKTRDVMALLEAQREKQSNDVVQASAAIAQDLDRFQQQKARDLRDMLLRTARAHAEFARKNLALWHDARREVSKIPTGEL
ncbi:Sorting nexin, cytoplasm-to-vacuole targeting pathway/endosomal sorting [Blastocladiella emersonii ATCC 22665]|nr:Sorting nexin, cytoplasm-to-vacuole targeting pathway/endosomal sorting [Blastocladiella emersonii ATCC 22665]